MWGTVRALVQLKAETRIWSTNAPPPKKKGLWREKCHQVGRFCLFGGVNHVKKHIQPKWIVIITDTIKDVPVNAVETYRRVNFSHLSSAPDASEWAASRTGRFISREYPHLHKSGWAPEPIRTFRRKNLLLWRESKSGSYTHQYQSLLLHHVPHR